MFPPIQYDREVCLWVGRQSTLDICTTCGYYNTEVRVFGDKGSSGSPETMILSSFLSVRQVAHALP